MGVQKETNPKHKKKSYYPSFFKVLIGDYAHKVSIPPAFVAKTSGNMPKHVIIKDRRGKSTWAVRIKEYDEKLCLTGRGWEMFVLENNLEDSDFLFFRSCSNAVFEVAIYGLNGCEKVSMVAPRGKTMLNRNSSTSRKVVSREGGARKTREPTFLVVLKKHHKAYLTIPKGFVHEAGIDKEKVLVLRTEQGKDWLVDMKFRVSAGYLSGRFDTGAGWRNFWDDNNLALTKSCLFKFVRGSGNVIHVKISSAK